MTCYPSFTLGQDTLYLTFRNEPKIYAYAVSNLRNLADTKTIPLKTFIQHEPKNDQVKEDFDIKDLFESTITKVIPIEGSRFLVDYLPGLTDEQYARSWGM